MLTRSQCLRRVVPSAPLIKHWPPIRRRSYSDVPDQHNVKPNNDEQPAAAPAGARDPEWFRQLRQEMLSRQLPIIEDYTSTSSERKLANTLSSYLPANWSKIVSSRELKPLDSVGSHLIFFNPSLPADQLLPDGTDPLQSPGAPFVRRMWAGGAIRLEMGIYFSRTLGWRLDSGAIAVERIQDVRLRGQGDAAKIFVTIERRFARLGTVVGNAVAMGNNKNAARWNKRVANKAWQNAFLTEERELVFMHERSAAEIEAIKAGNIPPVKYLKGLTAHLSCGYSR